LPDDQKTQRHSPLANISRRLVGLHKEYYGKGPTKAKTYYNDDLVVVLLRGGFTRVEETLRREGRAQAVIDQRGEFQEVMRERYGAVIEEEIGRKVIAFMSGSHQEPDLLAEVFVLEPGAGDNEHEPGAHAHEEPEGDGPEGAAGS
jgi:uncharacterized protein YbcI